jgi:hypothetical protein
MRRPVFQFAATIIAGVFFSSTSYGETPLPRSPIDAFLIERWQSASVTPSGTCDDATFVRRLYLDLIGRIPTLVERAEFLADTSLDKRERLVDQLLASPEYGVHHREVFDVVFMGRPERQRKLAERRRNGWHEYLETAFNANRPWDEVCREVVLARPTSREDRGAAWFLYERENKFQEIAEAVSPAVFGVQIQCAQCHDHPLTPAIEQRHYWGLVAFFNRGQNIMAAGGPQVAESAVGGWNKFADLTGASSDATLAYIGAKTIEEPRPADGEKESDAAEKYREPTAEQKKSGSPRVPVFSRREQFADEVLKDHPLVARAMANRLWGLYLGRGISHPVDKLDFESEPSHPGLLDYLAAEFRTDGYDVKRLSRRIVTSAAYQLSAQPTTGGIDPALFAHAIERPLIAETYYRSMRVAIGQETPIEQDNDLLGAFSEAFPDVLTEQSVGNLKQSLFLTNDPGLQQLFANAAARATLSDEASQGSPRMGLNELFLRCFGRHADPEELDRAVWLFDQSQRREPNGNKAWAAVAWALCTSAEFRWNH